MGRKRTRNKEDDAKKQIPTTTNKTGICKKKKEESVFQSNRMENTVALKSCDFMLLSQSGEEPEVVWNEAPIKAKRGSTKNIEELVKKFTTDGEPTLPRSPSLMNLWMDSPERTKQKNSSFCKKKSVKKSGRISRAKLKPKCLTDATELLNKLSAVLKSSSGAEEKEKGRNELKKTTDIPADKKTATTSSSMHIMASTQKSSAPLKSSPLESTCLSPILQKSQHCQKLVDSPPGCAAITKNDFTKTQTNNSHTEKSSKKLRTPKSSSKNSNFDEQWTDEELFEQDSFLMATQDIAELYTTPSPRKFRKRVLTSTPGGKELKPLKLDISPCAATKSVVVEKLFKQPEPVSLDSGSALKVASKKQLITKSNDVLKAKTIDYKKSQLNMQKPVGLTEVVNNKSRQVPARKLSLSNARCATTNSESSRPVKRLETLSNSHWSEKKNDGSVKTKTVCSTSCSKASVSETKEGDSKSAFQKHQPHRPPENQNSMSKKLFRGDSSCIKHSDLKSPITTTEPKDLCSSKNFVPKSPKSSDFNISISEELLACLAEPDDVLDSQWGAGTSTVTVQESTALNNSKTLQNNAGVSKPLQKNNFTNFSFSEVSSVNKNKNTVEGIAQKSTSAEVTGLKNCSGQSTTVKSVDSQVASALPVSTTALHSSPKSCLQNFEKSSSLKPIQSNVSGLNSGMKTAVYMEENGPVFSRKTPTKNVCSEVPVSKVPVSKVPANNSRVSSVLVSPKDSSILVSPKDSSVGCNFDTSDFSIHIHLEVSTQSENINCRENVPKSSEQTNAAIKVEDSRDSTVPLSTADSDDDELGEDKLLAMLEETETLMSNETEQSAVTDLQHTSSTSNNKTSQNVENKTSTLLSKNVPISSDRCLAKHLVPTMKTQNSSTIRDVNPSSKTKFGCETEKIVVGPNKVTKLGSEVKTADGGMKQKSFQKYPSNDSLNIFDSPKMIEVKKVSSSQESTKKGTLVCNANEIEKKRQEALKRRQSKLKLKKKV